MAPKHNNPGGSGLDREFWKGVAAFGIVLLAFAVLIWMIYEVVVRHNPNAYCDARPFFTPFFILAFSILGLFLGGRALDCPMRASPSGPEVESPSSSSPQS